MKKIMIRSMIYVGLGILAIPLIRRWRTQKEEALWSKRESASLGWAAKGSLEAMQQAAEKGSADAHYALGVALFAANRKAEGVEWLKRADGQNFSQQGQTIPAHRIANYYLEEKRFNEALPWYVKSSRMKHFFQGEAGFAAGLLMLCGLGAPRDIGGATEFLMRAGPYRATPLCAPAGGVPALGGSNAPTAAPTSAVSVMVGSS